MKIVKNVNVKQLCLDAGVRYWEDSDVNGEPDDANEPKVPFAVKTKISNNNPWKPAMVDGYRWQPVIDIDKGKIIDWPEDVEADIHYKVCDECRVVLKDDKGAVVYDDESYVPQLLCIGERGGGDYIIMHIEKGGRITDWNPNKLKDICQYRGDDY